MYQHNAQWPLGMLMWNDLIRLHMTIDERRHQDTNMHCVRAEQHYSV